MTCEIAVPESYTIVEVVDGPQIQVTPSYTVIEVDGHVNVIETGVVGPQGPQGPAGTGTVNGPQASTDNAIVRWDSTSGTLIQNSTATLSDAGLLDTTSATLDYFQIDTTATAPTIIEGIAAWDGAEGTLQIGLKNGVVSAFVGAQMYARVRNAEATALQKGEAVYLSGASGNRAEVRRASNTTDTTSNKTLGIVSETIASNQIGFVITQGIQAGLALGAPWVDGDIAWLGSTAGTITRTKPIAPNHLVFVGIVERANAGNGQLYVKPQNGYELDEIHDVLITTPQDGATLSYNAAQSVWVNQNILSVRTDTARVGIGTASPSFQLQLSTDSAAKPATSTWTVASDERLKTEIKDADLIRCWDIIKDIPLRHYRWKDGIYDAQSVPDRTKLGWIAQEVRDYFPKAVTEKTFITATGEEIDKCLDLNTDQLIAAMYGALQRAISKIEELEDRVLKNV